MSNYQERNYRLQHRNPDLVQFTVRVKETDLWIMAESELSHRAKGSIEHHRRGLEHWLAEHPGAMESLAPLPRDPYAPPMVKAMLEAGIKAGTGPMAAVAGATAQYVASDLSALSGSVVIENGGDLYIIAKQGLTVGIHAGESPFSGRLGLKIEAESPPLAVSTSSGTVGHSLSLGKADAATIISADGALADAVATALGNRVSTAQDMAPALEWAMGINGVLGAMLIIGENIAAAGDIELVDLTAGKG